MRKSILDRVLRQCVRELKDHPEYKNFPHWSFIVHDNQIISTGYNRRKEPSRKFGYHDHSDPKFRPKWHSELDAIKRSITLPTNFEIINVRLNRNGEIRNSFPCRTCQNLLQVFECRKVWFTTNIGWGKIHVQVLQT